MVESDAASAVIQHSRAADARRDVVVVGASAGGLDAVGLLLSHLPAEFPAAVLVVLHRAPGAGDAVRLLGRASPLPVRRAADGQPLYHGNVYVAPPDHHLVLEEDGIRVARGPHENRARPAIDPLFRSAAAMYGPRVVGVLLTGYLDDGVSGLAAIGRAGGVTMVQDPADAQVPDMPSAALARIAVDHVLPVHRMAPVLVRLAGEPVAPPAPPPADEAREVDIAGGETVGLGAQERLGEPADMGCPACGGPLRQVDDPAIRRFRCHVGHAYTARALLADQSEQVERALGAAMRTLEERARLLTDLAQAAEGADGADTRTDDTWRRAEEARGHAATLRHLLLAGAEGVEDAEG